MTDHVYLWMDLQLSSHDDLSEKTKVQVLELAAFMTDSRMNVLTRFTTPILETGSHPGTVRLETNPKLRAGYDQAGLWDAMSDGMAVASADIFLRDAITTAYEDYDLADDVLLTVVCRRAHLTSQIIKRDMPSLLRRISIDFIDVDTIKTFFETFMDHALTNEEFDFLFRPNTYDAEKNVHSNMEAISLILTKLPSTGMPELVSRKGRRSL